MTDARPAVSVILPTYNRKTYLLQAIESVRAQTRADWELLVLDDGSDDGTPDAVRRLGDERISVLDLTHTGRPAAVRNAGIRRARGRFVAFLDSDDRWEPDKLVRQLDEMDAHPACGWSYTDFSFVDGEGELLDRTAFEPWTPRSGDIVEPLLTYEAKVACPTVIVERALLLDVGMFDETLAFCEDYDLWLRLARRSPVCPVDARLTAIRIHAGNNTRDRPEVNESFMCIYERWAAEDPNARRRRLCRRQHGFHASVLADHRFRRGEIRQGWRAWRRAAPIALEARFWVVGLKGMLRSTGLFRSRLRS